MLNISNTFATVFQPECKGKYTTANISTGKKDKDGNWTNMSWRAKFVGKNQDVSEKLRIKILSGIVENRKWEDKWYTDIVIFDWELVEKKETDNNHEFIKAMGEQDDSELPF